MLLALINKIHTADREVREKSWRREPNRGWELKGKTIGIFGYGFMGSATAEKLSGFGCRVLAFDKLSDYQPKFARGVGWEEFTSEVQVLSLHLPLTEETAGMLDKNLLLQFPKLEIVINSARGEILVLEDLVELLEAGRIKGACLDVLENEKIESWTEQDHAVFDRHAVTVRITRGVNPVPPPRDRKMRQGDIVGVLELDSMAPTECAPAVQ